MTTSAPLTPADCDLRDFQFMPVDVHRLLTSETWILGTGDERAAAMTLWLASWHQVPAGSIPKDDRMLAHLSQSGPKWKKLKAHTLRGWVEASDGRLYHPVVCEKALEAWVEKLAFSLSGSAGNAKRWGVNIETDSIRDRALAAIGMLRALAPQSKTLKKKAVAVIESASQTDSGGDQKTSGGDADKSSGGDSGGDRKGQGQGQGQGQGYKEPHVERRDATPDRDVVGEVFAYWQKVMNAPGAKLDERRRKAIKAALKLYEPRQVCEAILGCSRSAWHMGENDRRQKFNSLGLILRDAEHIDKFVELASKRATGPESIEERNARILAELMAGDSAIDPDVIEVEMEEVDHA